MDNDSRRRSEKATFNMQMNWWMCILQSLVVFNTVLIKYMYETAKGNCSRLEG